MDRGQYFTDTGNYRQPARSLLIDLSSPFSQYICKQLCMGLENFLALVSSMSGYSHFPSLSITTLTTFPEMILPLQHVRGNFPRLQCALEEVQKAVGDATSLQSSTLSDKCLVKALRDVCKQFQRQSKVLFQTSGQWCQQEIVVISCQDPHKLSTQIEKICSYLSLENLRVVSVVLDEMTSAGDGNEATGSQQSNISETTSAMGGLPILMDVLRIDCDDLSIQHYFNSWLRDVATDREHLHIHLPSDSPSPGNKTLTLKCDLQERMINPLVLPGLSLSLQTQCLNLPFRPSQQGVYRSEDQLPIYDLKIEKMLPSRALCESIVFGVPLVIQPTSCWKIDWEELEENQQTFQSLSQNLSDMDMVLLGKAVMPRQYKKAVRNFEGKELNAWFVILPARNSLLIKSIAVNELMLPCNDTFEAESTTEESRKRVADSLKQLETIEMFNPLLTKSGLYEVLKAQYRKPDEQSRKKFNYKPVEDPVAQGYSRNVNKPGASVSFKRFCAQGSAESSGSSFITQL